MVVLDSIRDFFKRQQCTKLILYDSKNLTVKSLSADLPLVKVGLGEVDSNTTVLRQAGDAATTLDDFQFLLCQQLKSLTQQDPSRARIIELRTQGILWITALRMALAAYVQNPAGGGATLAKVAEEVTSRMVAVSEPVAREDLAFVTDTKQLPPPPGEIKGLVTKLRARGPNLAPSDLVLKLTDAQPEELRMLANSLATKR